MVALRKPAARPRRMRVARKLKPSAWETADRQDEIDAIKFHGPMGWMEDMSVWEDAQEANGYTPTGEED